MSSLSFESSAIPLPDVYSRLTTSTMRDSDADVDADDETSIELPTVLVPPEAELSFMSPAAASSSGLRGDEGVGYDGVRLQLKLFDDEVGLLRASHPATILTMFTSTVRAAP